MNDINALRIKLHYMVIKYIMTLLGSLICSGICFYFIITSYLGNGLVPTSLVSIGSLNFHIQSYYGGVICFILSIVSFFISPQKTTQIITELRLAIQYLEYKKRNKTLYGFQWDAINRAVNHVTEVEIGKAKKKAGDIEKITPHEKRMIFRQRSIIGGFCFACILSIALLLNGVTFPVIAGIDCILIYIIVLFEAEYYQIQLRKSGIVFFNRNHHNTIDVDQMMTKLQTTEQVFQYYQKVLYMRLDRYKNYSLVFNVTISVTNMLAVIITILDSTHAADFQAIFRIGVSAANIKVALCFDVISLILFFGSIVFSSINDLRIVKLEDALKIKFSNNNYKYIQSEFIEGMENNSEMNIFSRTGLDFGRGIYDYNNSVLIRNRFTEIITKIPMKCMATIEKVYRAKIPRFKLTALIFWLAGYFCFIWGNWDIINTILLTAIALTLYDFELLLGAYLYSRQNQQWIAFEINLPRLTNVRMNLCKELITHIYIITCLFNIYITMRFPNNLNILSIVQTEIALFCMINVFVFLKRKEISIKASSIKGTHYILLAVLSILSGIAGYLTCGTLFSGMCSIIVFVVLSTVMGLSYSYGDNCQKQYDTSMGYLFLIILCINIIFSCYCFDNIELHFGGYLIGQSLLPALLILSVQIIWCGLFIKSFSFASDTVKKLWQK